MKGEITLKILEIIEEAGTTVADLFTSFIGAGYGASFNKLKREFEKRHDARESYIQKAKEAIKKKQHLSKLIYKLVQEGLLVKNSDVLRLTTKGKLRCIRLKKRFKRKLPSKNYRSTGNGRLKIIIFDIPEREREKRSWLRAVLRALDFKLLQKSVWVGKSRVPQVLINDLEDLDILSYIEIFEITKGGSLKHAI